MSRPCRHVPSATLSAVTVFSLCCFGVAPVQAQIVLTGNYNNQPNYAPNYGNGYVATAGQSYLLTSTATFDNNINSGFVGGNVTVDGADISGNGNHGLTPGGNAVVNSGTFDNNFFEGLNLLNGTGVVNGGTFDGGGRGITDRGGLLTLNGGTFSHHTYQSIGALDGAMLNVYGGDFTGDALALDVYNDNNALGPNGFDPAGANIYGGIFTGVTQALYAAGTTITVYGNFVGGARTLQGSGTFTGTLQDGGGVQTISYFTANDTLGYRGKIVLANAMPAVPEPSPLPLLCLGILPLSLIAARRRARS